MNQAEAKTRILDLWSQNKEPWEPGDHLKFYHSAENFFTFLEENHPDLLSFISVLDKWQEVKAWINEFEGYPDC